MIGWYCEMPEKTAKFYHIMKLLGRGTRDELCFKNILTQCDDVYTCEFMCKIVVSIVPTVCTCVCMLSCFSCVWLFATLQIVARQTPLSMGISRQEYWSGLPSPLPGNLSNSGMKPMSPVAPLQADSLPHSTSTKIASGDVRGLDVIYKTDQKRK